MKFMLLSNKSQPKHYLQFPQVKDNKCI